MLVLKDARMNYDYDMNRRDLTDYEKADYENLRKIWNGKKSQIGLTQEKAAAEFGCSTSNIGHYLTGKQPLNIKTIIAFAKLLDVDPTDIDPRLIDLAPVLTDSELTLVRLFRRLGEDEKARVIDFSTRVLLDRIEHD